MDMILFECENSAAKPSFSLVAALQQYEFYIAVQQCQANLHLHHN